MKIHLPPPRGGKTNGEHVRMEKKRLHTYVQIQAISMSIKRISLSPQCNEASCQINCLPPSRLTLDFVFWANDRIRATDIMSFIFVVSSKGRQDGELFICFSHFPALLSLSLSLWTGQSAAGTDIHVSPDLSTLAASYFHPPLNHSSLSFCSLYFPYWWSTLDINLQLVRLDYLFFSGCWLTGIQSLFPLFPLTR